MYSDVEGAYLFSPKFNWLGFTAKSPAFYRTIEGQPQNKNHPAA